MQEDFFIPPLWALPCTVHFPHISRTFAEGKSCLSATEFIIDLVLTLLMAHWVLRWPGPAPQPSRPVSSSSFSFVQPHTRARWPRCGFCTCACFCPHRCTHSARGFSCQPFGLHGPLPASLSEALTFCFRSLSSRGWKLQAAATIPSSSLSDPRAPHRIGSWATFAQRKKTRARKKDPGSLCGVTGVPIMLKVMWF